MDAYGYCYQNPINLVDPDGRSAEDPGDIFSSDGRFLKNDGIDDKKVYVVDKDKIVTTEDGTKKWAVKDQIEIKGLTKDELNLRASLATLKQAEAGRSNAPLDYNSWNNGDKFTEDSFLSNPTAYAEHPGKNPNSGSSAAGAYQALKRFYSGSDFSPQSQDKAAVKNMTSASYKAALSGDMSSFKATTQARWTSLEHWSVPELQKTFYQNRASELSGNSRIATPIGKLLKN